MIVATAEFKSNPDKYLKMAIKQDIPIAKNNKNFFLAS